MSEGQKRPGSAPQPSPSPPSESKPPMHGSGHSGKGLACLKPGLSKSFGSASKLTAFLGDGGGGAGDSPGAASGGSGGGGSGSRRGSGSSVSFSHKVKETSGKLADKSGKLAELSGKLAGKLMRSKSEDGSSHGRNLYAVVNHTLLHPNNSGSGHGGSDGGSMHGSRSFSNLQSVVSEAASNLSLYRRASAVWDFGFYPTDADAYELIEVVGEGATATVWLAYCPSQDVDVAVKIVNLDEPSINLPSIITEVQTMKLLKHPNILPLYAAFLEEDQLWMVMPYVSGGSASDIMKRNHSNGLNEHCIATIMKPVLHALAYLHKDGYIHRDLKAGNILIDQQGKVILADMGVTAAMSRTHRLHTDPHGKVAQAHRASSDGMAAYLSRTTFAGTPCWMAPEVMEDGQPYDCSADIWSFGITLLEFALGAAPLQNFNLDQILMKTLNEPAPVLESTDRRKRFTEDLQDLVAKCLQKDPAGRTSADKLAKHRFFKAAYDGEYLVKQLDIGSGAALASHAGPSKGVIGRALMGAARQLTDKTAKLTGEEVDAQDAFKLLRKVTLPPKWLPDDSEPLDMMAVRTAKGLAFGMLKSHGTGVKFLRGSGFVIGRSVNSRRETRWSAPSYFTIDIRGLPPAFRNMEQVHLVMVLPSQEALDRLKAPEVDFEPDDATTDEEELPMGSPPMSNMFKVKSLGKSLLSGHGFGGHGLGSGSFAKRRHTVGDLSHERGKPLERSRSHSVRSAAPDRPEVGYAIEQGSQRVFMVPLQGARIAVDAKQNAALYGEEATPDSILDIRKTKRPAPFDRLVKDIEQMVEGAPLSENRPEDAQWFKAVYFFQ